MFKKNLQLIISFIIIVACVSFTGFYNLNNFNSEQKFEYLRNKVQIVNEKPIYKESEETDELLPSKYSNIDKENKNIVGWISNSERIDYPIMYCSDNYYIHKDINDKYSFAGSLYTRDRGTDVIVIYGHNMKNGSMFGTIKNYKDLDGSSFIYSDLEYDYKLDLKCYCVVDVNDFEFSNSVSKFVSNVSNYIINGSLDDLSDNSKLVVLCTCNNSKTSRDLLVLEYKKN